mmetsp:Transcript_51366/g.123154  ORF Transcript_51366/g.123154 Transcript_51366/m.123154 type:complete len:297 (-) Transcript_51366:585-1475(-)
MGEAKGGVCWPLAVVPSEGVLLTPSFGASRSALGKVIPSAVSGSDAVLLTESWKSALDAVLLAVDACLSMPTSLDAALLTASSSGFSESALAASPASSDSPFPVVSSNRSGREGASAFAGLPSFAVTVTSGVSSSESSLATSWFRDSSGFHLSTSSSCSLELSLSESSLCSLRTSFPNISGTMLQVIPAWVTVRAPAGMEPEASCATASTTARCHCPPASKISTSSPSWKCRSSSTAGGGLWERRTAMAQSSGVNHLSVPFMETRMEPFASSTVPRNSGSHSTCVTRPPSSQSELS